ncbi:cobalamin-dependent protein [Halobacillus litoralis]|uniref:cobalamin B12-binding domain-containing protein n=1 Tax=Halobacillus litoralis TaxID=45668 RepID=UPI001CD623B4|nr:cobalamin-dependent protein [Halobacillus litoralis]MCA0971723.1 cobalamin-dependent protein [Halobacillus litoralis]
MKLTQHHETLAHLFLDGDEEKALDYMNELLHEYSRAYLYESVITQSMYYIGQLWERNEISVADEHLATAVCDFVLSTLKEEKPIKRTRQQKALLFGVEKEQHYLGIKMVAETFKEQGWRVRYLGPDLPLEHSLTQIEKFKPDVIGLSAALSYRLPTVKELIRRFERLEWKPFIMVGGRMASKFDLNEFQSDRVMVVKGLPHLHQWFKEGRDGVINETS